MSVRPRPWMTRTPDSCWMVSTSGTMPTAAILSPVVGLSTLASQIITLMLDSDRPLIRTSPLYGSVPVESRILTSRKSILDSSLAPKIVYSGGCKLSANLTASMDSILRGRPLCFEIPASVVVDQGTAGSSRAGDMM